MNFSAEQKFFGAISGQNIFLSCSKFGSSNDKNVDEGNISMVELRKELIDVNDNVFMKDDDVDL